MANESDSSANAIIAQALQNAGVPPRNIDLPLNESAQVELKEGGISSLDGLPKPPVKGELEVGEPEPASPGPAKPSASEPVVQPFGKADIETAIDQASSKFQSLMDRKINQLTQIQLQTTTALNQFFQSQEDANIASLPVEEQVTKRLERLEKGGQQPKIEIPTQQPIEQQPAQFYQQLANFVDTIGLKIDDKRIDWAPDVSDPQLGFKRFLASIKTALVEDQTKVIQDIKNDGAKVITNLRKRTGVDKVSTAPPGGPGLPNTSEMTPMQKIEYGFQVQEELSQINQ